MKLKTIHIVLLIAMVTAMDYTMAWAVKDPTNYLPVLTKIACWLICSIITVGIVILSFIHFNVITIDNTQDEAKVEKLEEDDQLMNYLTRKYKTPHDEDPLDGC